jgi:UPF0716 protein FxsA
MPIFYMLLALPLIEIAGFVLIGPYLGVSGTLAFVLASSIIGLALLRRSGLGTLRRLQRSVAAGATPVPAALDGACRIIADVLLVLPGFVSTAVGLVLLLPPVRREIVRHLGARIQPGGGVVWQFRRGASKTVIIETEYHEVGEAASELPPYRRDQPR